MVGCVACQSAGFHDDDADDGIDDDDGDDGVDDVAANDDKDNDNNDDTYSYHFWFANNIALT